MTAAKTNIKNIPNPPGKKFSELVGKVAETAGQIEISTKAKNLLARIGTYGLNYSSELLSKAYNAPTEIGNAYGAICFAALDVLARKNTPFKRLAKSGGFLWYVGEGIYDLTLALTDRGNVWAHLGNFSLDVTMAYQLGKDRKELYEKATDSKGEKSKTKKDLEEVVSFFKEKYSLIKEKIKAEEKEAQDKNANAQKSPSKFKEYFSAFGKGIGQGFGYGISAGHSFGKNAFETLNKNYSAYRKEQKEKSEINKLENEKVKKQKAEEKILQKELNKKTQQEKAEQMIKHNELDEKTRQERVDQKIRNSDFENISLKNKKEVLEFLAIPGKNPNFMKDYEIENEYINFKQKPINEQIQVMQERKNYFQKARTQAETLPFMAKIINYSEISDIKSNLKKLDKILYRLDIEEKNPQRSPAMEAYIKKKTNGDE